MKNGVTYVSGSMCPPTYYKIKTFPTKEKQDIRGLYSIEDSRKEYSEEGRININISKNSAKCAISSDNGYMNGYTIRYVTSYIA